MTRIGFLTGVLLGLVLAVTPASAENRPSSNVLEQVKVGEVSRKLRGDGGGLAIVSADAGVGCVTVETGALYELHCSVAAHVCPWGDGGCSIEVSSPNYGRPVAPSTAAAPYPYQERDRVEPG